MDDRYEEFSDDFPEHWFSYKGQFADTNRDLDHEERKHNAIIYIRAHFDQMMENSLYRYIYYEIIDDGIRCDYPLNFDNLSIAELENLREIDGDTLDETILTRGDELVETYKDDLQYVVEWIKSGKGLIAFSK